MYNICKSKMYMLCKHIGNNESEMTQQRTYNVYILVIMQLQLWLELLGYVLRQVRYVV